MTGVYRTAMLIFESGWTVRVQPPWLSHIDSLILQLTIWNSKTCIKKEELGEIPLPTYYNYKLIVIATGAIPLGMNV